MPTPESSLSVAIQGLADFLDGKFDEDVVISVDSPQKAHEQAKTSAAEILNIFVHRIAPSGFHAADGHQDPFFIRAFVLLTAFPRGQGTPEPDADLRVLGHAVRVLQSFPVIPIALPGPVPAAAPAGDFRSGPTTEYRLQAIFQTPTMEELNHTWTTQGGELAYRLSASYELALIPIEPLSHRTPAPPVQTTEAVLAAGPAPRPFQMFMQGERLFSHLTLPAATAQAALVLTGMPKTQVDIRVDWARSGGGTERQAAQLFEIKTTDVEATEAEIALTLDAAASGDRATISATPVMPDGTPIAGAPAGNLLRLAIGA